MKTKFLLVAMVFLSLPVIFNTSCQRDQAAKGKSFEEFKDYVRIHNDSAQNYYDQTWEELESGYLERKNEMDKNLDKAEEDIKQQYEELNLEWEEFKNDYQQYQQIKATGEFRQSLIPADINQDFSNVGPESLLSVYQYFVDYVDKNKDSFTREQWDEIKIMWERLDTRKNEIEKELPPGDNNKIAGLKVEFAAIKTINRAGAKEEENEEAKEK